MPSLSFPSGFYLIINITNLASNLLYYITLTPFWQTNYKLDTWLLRLLEVPIPPAAALYYEPKKITLEIYIPLKDLSILGLKSLRALIVKAYVF